MFPSLRISRAVIFLIASLVVCFGIVFVVQHSPYRQAQQAVIPAPFSSGPLFRGDLSAIGPANGKEIVDVTFNGGKSAETLREGALNFILTPQTLETSLGTFATQINPRSSYYGYVYTSPEATIEHDRQPLRNGPNPVPYSFRFPGTFFATRDLLGGSGPIAPFISAHPDVSFVTPDQVSIEANARIIVFPVGADLSLATMAETILLPFPAISASPIGDIMNLEQARDGGGVLDFALTPDDASSILLEQGRHYLITMPAEPPVDADSIQSLFPAEAPLTLGDLLPADAQVYGYLFTDGAAQEKVKRAALLSGQSVTFKDLFPGTFFASDNLRATGLQANAAAKSPSPVLGSLLTASLDTPPASNPVAGLEALGMTVLPLSAVPANGGTMALVPVAAAPMKNPVADAVPEPEWGCKMSTKDKAPPYVWFCGGTCLEGGCSFFLDNSGGWQCGCPPAAPCGLQTAGDKATCGGVCKVGTCQLDCEHSKSGILKCACYN